MGEEYTYLDGCPDEFVRCSDVLLVLDDGSELPAYSQTLARFSSVCAGMLADGLLSNIGASKKAALPLPDCSRATVISLLSVLHAAPSQPTEHITADSSMAIARLAHRLDMKVYSHALVFLESPHYRHWRVRQPGARYGTTNTG